MASIVYLSPNNPRGSEVVTALEAINAGIAKLQELNGLRGECIAAGAGTMATVFGAGDNPQAQALNDRWESMLEAFNNPANTEYGKLRDLLNAVIHS